MQMVIISMNKKLSNFRLLNESMNRRTASGESCQTVLEENSQNRKREKA